MLKWFLNKLSGLRSDGFTPATSDKELIENVRARLLMFGRLQQPVGTTIRSIPGATVKFLPLAGMSVAIVYTTDDRPIGSITPNGEIVYVQARA